MNLKKYIFAQFLVSAVALNFFINAVIGYFIFKGEGEVFRWGVLGVCTDVFVNTVFITFITYLSVARVVGQHIISGKAEPLLRERQWLSFALKWPVGNFFGALLFTFFCLILVAGGWVTVLLEYGPPAYSVNQAIALKSGYAALLAALIVPPIALLALREQCHRKFF